MFTLEIFMLYGRPITTAFHSHALALTKHYAFEYGMGIACRVVTP